VRKPDDVVHPNIVFIGASVLLEPIHPLQNTGIGMAENACDAAHG
jgi:hypothetical protein